MILKLSILNNINIKNRTRNKVANIASSKSLHPGLWEPFPSPFLVSEKGKRSGDQVCWPYVNQSINPVFTLKMVAYYRKTNKNKLSKDTTKRKVYLSFTKQINILVYNWCIPDYVIEYTRHMPEKTSRPTFTKK